MVVALILIAGTSLIGNLILLAALRDERLISEKWSILATQRMALIVGCRDAIEAGRRKAVSRWN